MNFIKMFENFDNKKPCENNKENEDLSIEHFRTEIEDIKKNCINGVTLTSFKGAPEVNTNKLIQEDMEIWEKFKKDDLDLEELEEYRNEIDLDDYDRRAFANFLIKEILKKEDQNGEPKEA
jgi:hypothetical protein